MTHLLIALAILAAPAKTHRVKLAVLDVEDVSGTEAARARLLTQVVVGELSRDRSRISVISSSDIRQMLGFDRQKQLLGCQEGSCLAELGGALGVDYLLTGQLGKLGSRYRFDARLIDSVHSQVAASEGAFIDGNDDALADGVVRLVRALMADAHLSVAPTLGTPVGGLTASPSAPSHTAAWVTGGAAVVLAVGAALLTAHTESTFNSAVTHYQGSTAPADDASLKWSGPLSDALWVGAAACAGTSAYLFLHRSSAGAGGDVGLGGHF